MPNTQKKEDAILKIRHMSKHYGGVHAVDDINLDIHSGEILFIVGDNGAGKSTFVNILSGVVDADPCTEIYIDGQRADVSTPAKAQKHGISTVFQDLSLCDNQNAFQNIFLGRELTVGVRLGRSAMEKRTMDLFEDIGSNVPNPQAPVGTRSGGQRQAVAIARSLLEVPRIILMDEPTAALGVIQRRQVSRLSKRLANQNCAVVIISQDLQEVEKTASRAVVFRLGKIDCILSGEEITRDNLVAHITGAASIKENE